MFRRITLALLTLLAPLAATYSTTRASVAADLLSGNAAQAERAREDSSRVAWSRAARLRRGINLSHWFAQSPGGDYSENHLKTHTTARDIALIKSLGFDHVRFTVEPAPFFDWRARESGLPVVHPDDAPHMAKMTIEFGSGATSGVLRLPAVGGGWVPIHMTINRVELDKDTYAGLLALRLPTAEEIAATRIAPVDQAPKPTKRKARPRKDKSGGA